MSSHRITTLAELREHYPAEPVPNSLAKESEIVTPLYRELIEAAPFCVVVTIGEDGLDCSPRGDAPGFVRVRDSHTLEIPDRRGNNRLDTLRNLLVDQSIGLIFLIPGVGEAIRVRGHAHIGTDPDLLASHAVGGKAPASVIVVEVSRIYFQCARAIIRSGLWDPERHVDRSTLPTAGMLTEEQGGFTEDERAAYDAALAERQQQTLY
ncbi:pyridoxamine 5'-phosphate oxidase family protein [Actinomycetota bacterium]